MLDYDIVVSEFELQLRYYVHFLTSTIEKDMNPFISQGMNLIVPLLFLYKKDSTPFAAPNKPCFTVPIYRAS